MTDNSTPIAGWVDGETGAPVTRGDLAAEITSGADQLLAAVQQAVTTWHEQQDPAKLLAFGIALTNQLAGTSVPLLLALVQHDTAQDAIDAEVVKVVIPDEIPADFK